MGNITIAGNEIVFETFGEKVVLSPFGPDCIRFRSTAGGRIGEQNWSLLPQSAAEVQIKLSDDKAVMRNGRVSAQIEKNGAVTYFNGDEQELLGELWWDERINTALLHYGREYRHRGGSTYETKVYFKPYAGEHLYGLGQDPNDCLDLKGTTSELCQKNTRVSVPFLLSSRGYGLLWNNPAVGRIETVNNHTLWYMEAAPQVDYVIIAGDTPASIVHKLSDLTGRAPAFPQWASGYWQCKLRYETQEDLLKAAREYHRRSIPLSAIVIDFFHWTRQGEWEFDPKYWPDPRAMVEELECMGIRLVVSVWPTVERDSKYYREMAERNMMLKVETGYQGFLEFFGPQTFVDTTNPDARKYVWDIIKKNYYDYGIKAFWLDVAEPEIRPYHYDNMRMHIGNGLEASQVYPYTYAQMIYEGLASEGETEIVSLSRSAWLGSQRVGTLVWSGDIPSSFDSLRRQVKAGLNMSLCGIPWWTTDIGGFVGGRPSDESFRELLVRWFQFGVFLPVMRMHGARVWDEGQGSKHPELFAATGAENEIWSYGDKVYAILTEMISLREKLRPYVMEHLRKASEDGTPVMRPMFFDYPDEEICYTLDNQYMFGSDLLVAPVVEPGARDRAVYLPKGKWMRYGTREVLEGGRTIFCSAPLEQPVVWIKNGSALVDLL